jgi:hypothetical protein
MGASNDEFPPLPNQEKIMHLLLTPILAFDDSGLATLGALVLLLLSLAALVRSRMA